MHGAAPSVCLLRGGGSAVDTGFGQDYCWVWMSIIPVVKFSKDSMGRGGWDSMERVIVCEGIVMDYKGGVVIRVIYLEHS